MKLYITLLLLVCSIIGRPVKAAPLPVEAFASPPAVDLVSLSPDGTKLAMLQSLDTEKESLVLVKLYDLTAGKSTYLVKSDSHKMKIYALIWANNEQLLMKAMFASHRYGTPVTETRLVRIDVATGENKSVITPQLQRKLVRTPQFQSDIVALMPEDEEHILLGLDGFNYGTGTSLVKINLKGKLSEIVAHGREDLTSWVTDRNHQPRIAIFRNKATFQIKERLSDNSFRQLWQFDAFSEDAIWPLGFDADPNLLYVSTYHDGRRAIFITDLREPALQLKLVKADDNYDVPEWLGYSWQQKKIISIGGDFVDEERIAFQEALDKALPDYENQVISTSADQNRYIVLSTNETHAGSYYLGDRKAKSLTFLLDKFSQLPSELMVAKQKIQYKARDGLLIEGYLSLPKGQEQNTALPTIIFPHGGPISYDDGNFDYWTQFFANRGYAVLQMNFRGSAGYGYDFMKAGIQNWGLQMQDDVEDGTRWLIEQRIADPKRICIAGASYGGYAALMGAVKTPELYQCAISFAGVTDVEALVKSYRNFTNYAVVKKQIGDDYKALEQRSPVTHADKITIPVLLVHGNKDRSVPVKHSRDMHKALRSAKKNTRYVELEDGDHYLSINSHRLQAFTAMDTFLREYLPVTQN